MSCRNTSCSGCRQSQPNQLAHMDLGGCLYVPDSQEKYEDDSIWETDSDSDSSEAEEPSFLSQLSSEIQQDQDAALEEGARRLIEDFGDADSEVWAEVGSKEPEKEPLFEAPIPLGECPICYEELKMIDFTVTKCGHTFHSSCVFKAMEQNVDCPMCRCQLLEIQEEEEDEDEEGEDQEEEDEEDQEGDEESEGEDEPKVTLEQLYTKLQNMGYSPLDILALAVENANLKRQDEARNTPEFLNELGDKVWGVVVGDILLSDRDQRTYAQVAAGPPVQLKDLERRLLANRPQPQEV